MGALVYGNQPAVSDTADERCLMCSHWAGRPLMRRKHLTHTHSLIRGCTVCDSLSPVFSSAVSHEYFTVCLPPDEFALLFFLPHLLLLIFFYPGDSEEGGLVFAGLPQVQSTSGPSLHLFYMFCCSFPPSGYTSSKMSLLSRTRFWASHLQTWMSQKWGINFEKQWTKRGETDRCFTLHTQERKQERGSSAAPSAGPLLSPPCTQMFRYPLLSLSGLWTCKTFGMLLVAMEMSSKKSQRGKRGGGFP